MMLYTHIQVNKKTGTGRGITRLSELLPHGVIPAIRARSLKFTVLVHLPVSARHPGHSTEPLLEPHGALT